MSSACRSKKIQDASGDRIEQGSSVAVDLTRGAEPVGELQELSPLDIGRDLAEKSSYLAEIASSRRREHRKA